MADLGGAGATFVAKQVGSRRMRAMLKRALVVAGSFALLALANTLAEASVPKGTTESKKEKPTKPADGAAGTAQEGEACKTDADCAQDKLPLSCVKSKCRNEPLRPPPPT
jgi:hypothetical protein